MNIPIVNSADKGRLGKVFEAKISQAFRDLAQKYPVSFKRLPDSREAGNLIKANESDFEFIVKSPEYGCPYHFMIEAKMSEKYDTFAPCFRAMVKNTQRALMMARERAGCKGYYMFYSVKTGMIELWDGTVINAHWSEKRKPLDKQPRLVISLANLPNFAIYMAMHPHEFATISL